MTAAEAEAREPNKEQSVAVDVRRCSRDARWWQPGQAHAKGQQQHGGRSSRDPTSCHRVSKDLTVVFISQEICNCKRTSAEKVFVPSFCNKALNKRSELNLI